MAHFTWQCGYLTKNQTVFIMWMECRVDSTSTTIVIIEMIEHKYVTNGYFSNNK